MAKTKGKKTKLEYEEVSGTTATWVKIGSGVVSIKPPESVAEDIDTSNMDSPEDAAGNSVKEYEAGWVEPGEAEVVCQFNKTELADAYELQGVTKDFRITFSDGSKQEFSGYLKSVGPEVDREKLVTHSLKFKVSGPVTFTPGS